MIFGIGTIERLKDLLQEYPDARRVLVVSGRHHVKESGLGERIGELVEEARKSVSFYYKVPPEPTVEAVLDTLAFARGVCPHIIIGVGGGSPLDVAKLTSMLLMNPKDPSAIIGEYEPFPRAGVPYIAIPTTSGSGSEVTPYSVIIDPKIPKKAPVVSRLSFPRFALNDPLLTLSCPPDLTARAGIDALSHCLEAFLSKRATPISDAIALKGIELIFSYLPQAVSKGEDIEARERVMLASLLGGMAIASAGAGLIHQLGHALAAFTGIPHGSTMALFMAPVLEFYGEHIQEKMREVALKAQIELPSLLPWLRNWLSGLGQPISLAEVGYKEEWQDTMVHLVMSRRSVMEALPKTPKEEDLIILLNTLAEN